MNPQMTWSIPLIRYASNKMDNNAQYLDWGIIVVSRERCMIARLKRVIPKVV